MKRDLDILSVTDKYETMDEALLDKVGSNYLPLKKSLEKALTTERKTFKKKKGN